MASDCRCHHCLWDCWKRLHHILFYAHRRHGMSDWRIHDFLHICLVPLTRGNGQLAMDTHTFAREGLDRSRIAPHRDDQRSLAGLDRPCSSYRCLPDLCLSIEHMGVRGRVHQPPHHETQPSASDRYLLDNWDISHLLHPCLFDIPHRPAVV